MHQGWITEIDPFDAAAMPKKRTAMGRFRHENAAVTLAAAISLSLHGAVALAERARVSAYEVSAEAVGALAAAAGRSGARINAVRLAQQGHHLGTVHAQRYLPGGSHRLVHAPAVDGKDSDRNRQSQRE